MSYKKALITGVTGQDGSVLAEILLQKGYRVCGMRPYLPVDDTERLYALSGDIELVYGDLGDSANLARLLEKHKPDEIYNLAAMSHVQVSFSMPEHTANVNAVGPVRLLEAMRMLDMGRDVRFYQASSSEMFGNTDTPQNEETPFAPAARMAWPNFMLTGWCARIAMHTDFTPATGFCSIMKARCAASNSSRARSRARSVNFRWDGKSR